MSTESSASSSTAQSNWVTPDGKHKLASPCAFWVLRNSEEKGGEYDMRKLTTFSTVEDFWRYYSYLQRPSAAPKGACVACFKEGFSPKWEDPALKKGGRWSLKLKPGLVPNRFWESALITLVGDEYQLGDSLVGVFFSKKRSADQLSFWVRDADDKEGVLRVREVIKKAFSMYSNQYYEFQAYDGKLNVEKEDAEDGAKQK